MSSSILKRVLIVTEFLLFVAIILISVLAKLNPVKVFEIFTFHAPDYNWHNPVVQARLILLLLCAMPLAVWFYWILRFGLKQKVCLSLSLLCGAVFIVSGATKLMPVEAFEISLADIGVANWQTAPFLARLMIGLEFVTGFLLIFGFRLKKISIPLASFLLAAFTIYLLYVIKVYGNRGSCGCFGTVIEISPVEGIIKNVVLLMLLGIVYFLAEDFNFRFKTPVAIAAGIVLIALPFAINPMGNPFGKLPMDKYQKFELSGNLLYEDSLHVDPATDIYSGKHIVAFMSATCPHCRLAAKKLVVFKKHQPTLPVVFVLFNNKAHLPLFFDDTKSDSIPHMLINSQENFLKMTNGSWPRIYWVNKGTVEYETNYYQLDEKDVWEWLEAKDSLLH